MSQLEETLLFHLRAMKLPEPSREYRFAAHHVGLGPGIKDRLKRAGLQDWRFDAAYPDLLLAIEVEGGGWTGGRHTRGAGFAGDLRKYDAAMRLGWTVYRCAGELIKSGQAVKTIHQLIVMRRGKE